MKNLQDFVNEEFDEFDAVEALVDEACDEFIDELNIDGESDEEVQEALRAKAKALKGRARKAIKTGASKIKSKAKNAKSAAKGFVKSLWSDDSHF